MPENLQSYHEFITETAYLAGRLTLGYFQAGVHTDFKADQTPVTIADRQSEELIRKRIEQRYPRHAIVGEEFGSKESQSSSHRWLIDPIDGTKSFIHGVPLYAVPIGLETDGVVEAGAAYFPALEEMISAASGLGCWWNGRRARVSPVDCLERSVAAYTDAASFAEYNRGPAWERIQRRTWFQAGWGDAYGYALVATGRAEIMLDPIMNLWDCGPFPPILREAGGYFGDWQGKGSIYANEALATTNTLLPQLLELIAGDQL
ncbi:MAG: inositol monophosphatase family protein [Chloroflexota bacterium]|nr:MAG: inositol monophosphatase family protein [Chloroflexota bacterium]